MRSTDGPRCLVPRQWEIRPLRRRRIRIGLDRPTCKCRRFFLAVGDNLDHRGQGQGDGVVPVALPRPVDQRRGLGDLSRRKQFRGAHEVLTFRAHRAQSIGVGFR